MMMSLVQEFGGLLWTLAAFVVALLIIVGVHEFGHYIVARWSGIRAEVFSLGFGPRLWSRVDRRGTVWQLAAVPLGGYVKFFGDDNAASVGMGHAVDPALRRQSLPGAPLWARFATVSAGPIFNFILSAVIFAIVIAWQGIPTDRVTVGSVAPMPPGVQSQLEPGDVVTQVGGQPVASWTDMFSLADKVPAAPTQTWTVEREGISRSVIGPDLMPPRVSGVAPRSPASSAGLQAGDVIQSIDGHPVVRFAQLRQRVEAADGRPVVLNIWREGVGEADFTLIPREQDIPTATGFEKRFLIGVTGGEGYIVPGTRHAGPIEAVGHGIQQTWDVIASSVSGLWAVLTGVISRCNVSGAISIAEVAGQVASTGVQNFLWLIAVLSAGIGFLNLLPIPVLDGGHLAFYAYEAVMRRPPPPRAIGVLSAIGLAMVLSLMFFGLSNDILCR